MNVSHLCGFLVVGGDAMSGACGRSNVFETGGEISRHELNGTCTDTPHQWQVLGKRANGLSTASQRFGDMDM